MSMHLTCEEVRDQLVREGAISGTAAIGGQAVHTVDTPWFIRVLVGFGAWVSVGFVVAFLTSVSLFNEAVTRFIFGVILTVGAVFLRRTVDKDFTNQVALVSSIVGQGLLLSGVVEKFDSVTATMSLLCVMSAVLIAVFPDVVHRFLSTVTFFVAATVGLYDGFEAHAVELMALSAASATSVLWLGMDRFPPLRGRRWVVPAAFGSAVSLAGLVVANLVMKSEAMALVVGQGSHVDVLRIGLGVGLLVVAMLILREADEDLSLRANGFALVLLLLVLVASVTTAGVVVAVGLGLLGTHRRSPTLVALGLASLLGFGAFYYYDLHTTLLMKSGLLVGNGLAFLGGAYLVHNRRKEVA